MTASTIQEPAPVSPGVSPESVRPAFAPPYRLAARIANVALTAQVQLAHACAVAAGESAERAADCIERAWPDTPLRTLVVQAYRAQARSRRQQAAEVLARARRHCGLAFARI